VFFESIPRLEIFSKTVLRLSSLPQLIPTHAIAGETPAYRRVPCSPDRPEGKIYRPTDINRELQEDTKSGLITVVKETMQPEHVSLWLRPDAASGHRQSH
jgi:hypothetical protein